MDRRTLLKGTAAGVAIGLTGGRLIRPASAQASWYEASVIYQFTEFKDESYDPISDGQATSVAGDGTIAGVDRVDGKRVPVTWDLSGNRQVLPTGKIEFADARWSITNGDGKMISELATGSDLTAPMISVAWEGQNPSLLPGTGAAGESISAWTIADNGIIGGSVRSASGSKIARWVDGVPEFPEDDALSGFLRKLSPAGNAYGSYQGADATRPTIWRWDVDGTVSTLPLPDELMAESVAKVPVAQIIQAFDPDTVVIDFWWDEGDGNNVTGTWVYQNGVYQRARGTAQGLAMSADFAAAPDFLFGDFVENGIGSGSGMLSGGTEILLDTITTLPGYFILLRTIGVTSDGTIVMTGGDDSVFPRAYGILTLRPVA